MELGSALELELAVGRGSWSPEVKLEFGLELWELTVGIGVSIGVGIGSGNGQLELKVGTGMRILHKGIE